ncbi:unnamed protein product [Didymodactylos carnosus]|uniref:Arp2/3 complex 34 kDa subunit n=1 Tax=Didymodactylos carnosus TaxID=1234261 RepID=A0A813NLT4_9BILA|nr:unnamed protein product [Didymodactylos carnosus]CAF0739422.1 unnamed protein product [Didymodactylos carnosus]CAF3492377.1 unnamed protein product [Didymodactylos carnosus]CAF3517590.1 unnamed protein product [Didymodactylos carnosus]
MILLEVHNRIIEEILTTQIETFLRKEKLNEIRTKIVDFDGVLYYIKSSRDKPLTVSIKLKFFRDLEQHGMDELLRREYGDLLVAPEDEYNVTLSIDFSTQLPAEDWQALVRKVAMLKRNCFAAVFEKYFEFQSKQEVGHKRAVIHYRDDETMYVDASADRVIVIFSTVFKDSDDNIIGKVFMEEFKERRRNFQQAPQVLVNYRTPPEELKDMKDARVGDNIGYLTFVLFPRHTKPAARDNTINLIHTLRNYFHYHIKCCKAYLHSHMRQKTNEFLKRLQLARPEVKKNFKRGAAAGDGIE